MFKHIWLKDLKAEFCTWKSLVWLLIISLVFSVTAYLLLTNRELSLLDQVEMLWLFSKSIISAALLVVVVDASSLITSEFENETIENLFLSPLSVRDFVVGKTLASLTLWALVYAVAVPYMVVASEGSGLLAVYLGYVALFGTLIVLGFVLLVFAVSFIYRSLKNTLTTTMVILLACAIPALFSSTLKSTTIARIAGNLNPLDNVFSSLDNVLVDYKTSVLHNITFLIPVILFCAIMFVFLVFSVKAFKKRGIVHD